MNSQQAELYQRIQAFSLDAADTYLPLSQRLAQENGWALEYAQRVIDEYKKFVFLAVVADHPVSPSDQVDQVWHLHLLYTHSYWEEFCPKVLKMPLHHSPTQGGSQERRKFNDWYNKTLTSYEQIFQQSPPVDIWSPSHIRFGRDIHFVKVNTQSNWILPRPQLNLLPKFRLSRSAIFVLSFCLALGVTGCTLSNIANLPNPLNLSFSEFTISYLLAALIGILLISIAGLFERPGEIYKIRLRLLLILTFSLLALEISKIATGLSNLTGQDFLSFYFLATVTGFLLDFFARLWPEGTSSQSLSIDYTPSWEEFKQQTMEFPSFEKTVKWLIVLSVFILYVLGSTRVILGISRDRPVGYLAVLCVLVGIHLLVLLFGRFKEDFSNIWRIFFAIPAFLSIPSFLWLGFRSLGVWMFVGLWIAIALLQGNNSGGGGGGGVYWSGGSSDGGGGDGGCGGGCGGCSGGG
ncbi:MAG: hypothetical protein KME08_04465 [Aphanothece sp. CMT-3BRIN-NPC111]|jgi:hypothetical protein|nr:hypothetical protein [Aphanothece sp. CMT-3BRIN-NPC111]